MTSDFKPLGFETEFVPCFSWFTKPTIMFKKEILKRSTLLWKFHRRLSPVFDFSFHEGKEEPKREINTISGIENEVPDRLFPAYRNIISEQVGCNIYAENMIPFTTK